jgi:hypothetical protein
MPSMPSMPDRVQLVLPLPSPMHFADGTRMHTHLVAQQANQRPARLCLVGEPFCNRPMTEPSSDPRTRPVAAMLVRLNKLNPVAAALRLCLRRDIIRISNPTQLVASHQFAVRLLARKFIHVDRPRPMPIDINLLSSP